MSFLRRIALWPAASDFLLLRSPPATSLLCPSSLLPSSAPFPLPHFPPSSPPSSSSVSPLPLSRAFSSLNATTSTPTTSTLADPSPAPLSDSMDRHQRGDALDLSSPQAVNPPALGIVTVTTTRNNTIITLADVKGRTRTWASGGTIGETNTRKSTAFAAEQAAETVGRRAMEMGLDAIKVRVKGVGQGRDASVKGLRAAGVRIVHIVDATPIPHNGCRPPKRRRL